MLIASLLAKLSSEVLRNHPMAGWLGRDVLSLAGPHLEERRDLFDFIAAQLRLREALAVHWIRPLRVALQRQRDDVLGLRGCPWAMNAHE